MDINWNDIRIVENSQNEGFEELVCQLARREDIKGKNKYTRKGKPDAGVECFWILENNEEWAWQAKFFTSSLTNVQWGELDNSVRTALEKHQNLKKYIIALPIDPPDARNKTQKSMLQKWDERVEKWKLWAADKGLTVDFEPWWSSDIISRMMEPENAGITYFFFNKEEFTIEWCIEQTELSITDLGERYTPQITPELNLKLEISQIFSGISRDENFEEKIKKLFDDYVIKCKKIITKNTELEKEISDIQKKINEFYELFTTNTFLGINKISYDKFDSLLDQTQKIAIKLEKYYLDKEGDTALNRGHVAHL